MSSAQTSPRQPRKTSEEKARFVERARVLRAEGVSWNRIGKELGVAGETASRWCREAEGPMMLPVELGPKAAVGAGLRLTTPDGFTVEGLDVDAAYMLLDSLRC